MTEFKGFDDLDDLSFDYVSNESSKPASIEDASKNMSNKDKGTWIEEICMKCNGSGIYRLPSSHGTQCFACNGAGKRLFRKSKEERAVARQKAAVRKQNKLEAAFQKFEEANPDLAAWWTDSTFGFAISLREAAKKYGHLTENQLNAARRCIEKFEAAKIEREKAQAAQAEKIASMPVLDLSKIEEAMSRAKGKGIKRPKMRLLAGDTGFVLTFASESGRWAGSLYLKGAEDDMYYGRITEGKFHKSRDVSEALESDIIKSCENPSESAVAYGRRTGTCSCCGRELTDHNSIEMGIGPICAGHYFGG